MYTYTHAKSHQYTYTFTDTHTYTYIYTCMYAKPASWASQVSRMRKASRGSPANSPMKALTVALILPPWLKTLQLCDPCSPQHAQASCVGRKKSLRMRSSKVHTPTQTYTVFVGICFLIQKHVHDKCLHIHRDACTPLCCQGLQKPANELPRRDELQIPGVADRPHKAKHLRQEHVCFCRFACVCICTHIYMYMYVYVYLYMYMYLYIYVHMYTCRYVCMCICLCI